MRILIIAILTSAFPILLILSLIPRLNRVAGAVISVAVAIAGGIPRDDFAGSLIRLVILFASLTIPLIASTLMDIAALPA